MFGRNPTVVLPPLRTHGINIQPRIANPLPTLGINTRPRATNLPLTPGINMKQRHHHPHPHLQKGPLPIPTRIMVLMNQRLTRGTNMRLRAALTIMTNLLLIHGTNMQPRDLLIIRSRLRTHGTNMQQRGPLITRSLLRTLGTNMKLSVTSPLNLLRRYHCGLLGTSQLFFSYSRIFYSIETLTGVLFFSLERFFTGMTLVRGGRPSYRNLFIHRSSPQLPVTVSACTYIKLHSCPQLPSISCISPPTNQWQNLYMCDMASLRFVRQYQHVVMFERRTNYVISSRNGNLSYVNNSPTPFLDTATLARVCSFNTPVILQAKFGFGQLHCREREKMLVNRC